MRLWIQGLGEEIKEIDLAEFFGQQGEVVGVRIAGRFAWVEFGAGPSHNYSFLFFQLFVPEPMESDRRIELKLS